KERRLSALAEQETDLARQIEALAAQETAHGEELQQLRARIEPVEQRLAHQEHHQAALEIQERQLQDALRKDEAAWNAAQLQLQRTEDYLHQLRHDIEQDLGLVLLELGEDLAYQPPLPWDAVVEQLRPVESL